MRHDLRQMEPTIIYDLGKDGAYIRCPSCGVVGQIDSEQLRGEVSIDCPDCEYHETHDLTPKALHA